MTAVNDLDPSVRETLIEGLAQEIVSELAPEEAAVVPAASRMFFADPEATLGSSGSRDRVLGFGSALGAFLTPVVLRVLSEVVELLTNIAKKSVQDGVSSEVSGLVKGMFGRFRAADAKPPIVLNREQLALVHSNVVLTARKLRLPPDQAQSLANAVTARLVLSEG